MIGPRRTRSPCRAATAAALCFGACASQKPAQVRELAHEVYTLRNGDEGVGWEVLTLSTLPDFGKRLVSDIDRTYPTRCQVHIEADLAPDWSIRSVKAISEETPGDRLEWTLHYDNARQEFLVLVKNVRTGSTPGFDSPGKLLFSDSIALALVLARAHDLDAGGPQIQGPAPVLWKGGQTPLMGTMTLQRLADRGRRQAYRYRLGFGEWYELETDQRGLPLLLHCGSMTVERRGQVQ